MVLRIVFQYDSTGRRERLLATGNARYYADIDRTYYTGRSFVKLKKPHAYATAGKFFFYVVSNHNDVAAAVEELDDCRLNSHEQQI